MQAKADPTTNVVDLATRRQPRVADVEWPAPPIRTPELAALVAVMMALSPAQRAKVKTNLRRLHVANPTDVAAMSAHLYIGQKL